MLIDYKKEFFKSFNKQDFKKAYKLAAWGEVEKASSSILSHSSILFPYSFWMEWWEIYLRMWGVDFGSD